MEGERLRAFLDEACGDDPTLRRDVDELLGERDSIPSILRTGGSESFLGEVPDGTPHEVGPYRILSHIGAGGMGAVYLAEQSEPLPRQVALKLIKPGLDSAAFVARFEAERQVLALLHHPNIAQVYDAGTTELGRPYFVMEYVPGISITRFCDLEHLALRDRLELFGIVCSAIQHAHQRGVIHRDIKPSNVLVTVLDGVPVPKVIDFGIAKATENRPTEGTLLTMPGQIIGTPGYMSPEQTDPGTQDIDITTDVYSLGALLYELLTGAPPLDGSSFDGVSFDEIRRRIREDSPPRPSRRLTDSPSEITAQRRGRSRASALARDLRGDLDWITMRAMEKERDRRYPSAAELREEVERYLRGDPVLAGPPSAGYRVGKMIRRHKVAFAGIAGVFLAMAAGLGVSTTLYFRAEAARAEAAQEARKAERVSEFLQSMLRSADPEVGSRDVTVLEVLETTAETLDDELADDPAVLAAAHATLGNTFDALGSYDEATRHLRTAVEIYRRTLPPGQLEIGGALNDLGIVLNHAGLFEESESVAREGLAIVQAHYGREHSETTLARTNLAIVLKNLGRYEEAEPLYRETLEIDRRLLGEDPQVATDMNNLAVLLRVQGRHDEAIDLYREALALNRKVAGAEHHMTATILANLAAVLNAAGRYEEAEPVFHEVIEIDRRTLGEDHPYVATDLNNLATLYHRQGKFRRAEETVLEALELRCRILGPDHPSVSSSLMVLGSIRVADGHPENAESAYREALEIRREHLPPDHPDVAWTEARLGGCLTELGRRAEAEPLLIGAWERSRDSENVSEGRRRDILERVVALYAGWDAERETVYREELRERFGN